MSTTFISSLGFMAIIVFILFMLFTREEKNRVYIKFILIVFPLMQITINVQNIGFTIFNIITYLFFFSLYKRRYEKLKTRNIYLLLFLFVLLSSIIGCVKAGSMDMIYTPKAFMTLGSIFIFAKIVVEECLEDTSFIYTIINCFKVSFVLSLLFLICQFIFGVSFTLAKVQNVNILSQGTRYFSYFNDPQLYSQYLGAVSFLFLIKEKSASKLPIYNYLFFLLAGVAILCTGGRAGFGGWGLGLLIILLLGNSSYRFAAIVGGIVLYFVIYSYADSLVILQRSSLTDSYDFRYVIWLEALEIFYGHSLFGIGLGNYRNYISIHFPDQVWTVIDGEPAYFDHPESGYLKFLTEIGLIGFIPLMLIILLPVFKGIKLFIKSHDMSFLFLIATITSWMVGFYTVYSFADVRMEILIITVICLLITGDRTILQDYAE